MLERPERGCEGEREKGEKERGIERGEEERGRERESPFN